LAFSTCPPWPCATSIEVARTCAGLPVRLRLGSGDHRLGPRDLRLSFGDAFRFARSSFVPSRSVSCLGPEGHMARPWSIRSESGLLSWGCQTSPLRRHVFPASTPGRALAPKSLLFDRFPEGAGFCRKRSLPSARRCHPSNSFRPCRSSRLRRFSPLERLQVFCTLQPTMGFATFQVRGSRVSRLLPQGEVPCARLPAPLTRGWLPLPRLSPSFRSSEELRLGWRPVASGSRDDRDHPRWRHTLRSFPLADSRSTSPWSLPSRH
jgi:hypothetical protein